MSDLAAIHQQFRAGAVGSLVRKQKCDGVCNLFGLAEPPHGNRGHRLLVHLGIINDPSVHGRLNGTRSHHIGADTVRPKLQSNGFTQLSDRPLGGAVVSGLGKANETADGAEKYDGSAGLLFHRLSDEGLRAKDLSD